jgi:hypothetical protein
VTDHTVRCLLRGEPDALLKAAAAHHVVRWRAEDRELEDLFLDFYRVPPDELRPEAEEVAAMAADTATRDPAPPPPPSDADPAGHTRPGHPLGAARAAPVAHAVGRQLAAITAMYLAFYPSMATPEMDALMAACRRR